MRGLRQSKGGGWVSREVQGGGEPAMVLAFDANNKTIITYATHNCPRVIY
jgi:hypothetical protein